MVFESGDIIFHRQLLIPVGFAENLPPSAGFQLHHFRQLLRGGRLVPDKTDFGNKAAESLVDFKGDFRLPSLDRSGLRIDLHILVSFVPIEILHGDGVAAEALLGKNVSWLGHCFLLLEGVGQGLRPLLIAGRQGLELKIQQVLLIDRQLIIHATVCPLAFYFHVGNAHFGIHQDRQPHTPLAILRPHL